MTTVLASTLTSEDCETIRSFTEQRWTAAALTRDWGKALAMCAPDVVYMPADQPVLHGHEQLRAWLNQLPPIVKFAQPLDSVEGNGNLASARNTFAVTVDISGKRVENTGKVLCWFQKDTSGQWLAKAVCWNWDRWLLSYNEAASVTRRDSRGHLSRIQRSP